MSWSIDISTVADEGVCAIGGGRGGGGGGGVGRAEKMGGIVVFCFT